MFLTQIKKLLLVGKQMLLVILLACHFDHVNQWLPAKLGNESDQALNTDVGKTMLASFARPLISRYGHRTLET